MPDTYQVPTVEGPVNGEITPPGSKSYSNRALPIAAMARGASRLTGFLDSEDTQVMRQSLERLGVTSTLRPSHRELTVNGCAGEIPASDADLYLANSGTSIRFLTALVSSGHGRYRLDGVARMRERPIGDLLEALRSLGVAVRSETDNDCPPVVVEADGIPGGRVRIRGDVSSQFLSGLLMAAPLAKGPLTVQVDGTLVSQPYIEMTLAVMAAFGADVTRDGYESFTVASPNGYVATDYTIEPDASGASYFFAAAAVTGGTVTVPGLGKNSLQGDLRFVQELEKMGCEVVMDDARTTVKGAPLKGVDADMCHISDTVPTLAAVACFASSPTRIRNVAHIRRKETDRLTAIACELRKCGAGVDERPDGLTIHPGPLKPAVFDTYDDHRMAMALSTIGLRVPGVVINDPGCTAKTYPTFFEDLRRLSGFAS